MVPFAFFSILYIIFRSNFWYYLMLAMIAFYDIIVLFISFREIGRKNTYLKESKAECIFCPYSPDSKTIAHWNSIEEVQNGDIIFHECDGSIFAVSEAKGNVYDSERPYPNNDGIKDRGRKLDLSYVWLKSQIDRKSDKFEKLRKDLYESQPEKVAPFDKNGKGNEGYLFYFNDVCAKLIFNEMLGQR